MYGTFLGKKNNQADNFNDQELTNTAWAFATVGQPSPAALDPISVLDVLEAQGSKPKALQYQMLMQCIAMTGQIEAGFSRQDQSRGTRYGCRCLTTNVLPLTQAYYDRTSRTLPH